MLSWIVKYLFDEENRVLAENYTEELNRKSYHIIPLLGLICVVAFLPYIHIDQSLHPEEKYLPLLRIGLTVIALLTLLMYFLPYFRNKGIFLLSFLGGYAMIGTGIITGLAKADAPYLGGYGLVIMIAILVPMPIVLTYSAIFISLFLFFLICFLKSVDFQNPTLLYSLNDLFSATIISCTFIYVRARKRLNVYNKSRAYQKQNKEIQEKNSILEQQKEEITSQQIYIEKRNKELNHFKQNILSSINYAKNIQGSTLPSNEKMQELLGDYFLIYQPKDIVSGDFYWLSRIDNQIFVAVADCTGHGVPGAFMSMIGNSLLNDLINKNNINSPAEVLERMHIGIRNALQQTESGTSNSDGMDIGLCVFDNIDSQQTKLTFAGAKLPLFYYSQGSLYKLQGERKSIAGWQKGAIRTFANQNIILNKNDLVYFSTDGFWHASNLQRKAIGESQFQQILQDKATLPLSEQKIILENFLHEHQNGVEQRDDITLIGFRI